MNEPGEHSANSAGNCVAHAFKPINRISPGANHDLGNFRPKFRQVFKHIFLPALYRLDNDRKNKQTQTNRDNRYHQWRQIGN